jgi:hypothetical protein
MQPTHATSDMKWAEARVGPERIKRRLCLAFGPKNRCSSSAQLGLSRRNPEPVLWHLCSDHAAGSPGQSAGQLVSRTAAHTRGGAARLYHRRCLCGV